MNFNINYYEKRKMFYIVAAAFLVVSILAFIIGGFNKGIDFQSGTLIDVTFNQEVSSEDIRSLLADYEVTSANIVSDSEGGYTIKAEEIDQDTQTEIFAALTEKFGEYTLNRTESVGPTIGKELTSNALVALAIASVLMIIYISIRFQFKYAIAAIICLLHDVTIMCGFFCIFRIEVDSSFIAAILTIICYSINNTIVIFDRVREEKKMTPKLKSGELVNVAITKSMTRSINMALAVIIVLLALLIFGGTTTKNLALALTVGNIAGFYSSVFLSGNIWADFMNMK